MKTSCVTIRFDVNTNLQIQIKLYQFKFAKFFFIVIGKFILPKQFFMSVRLFSVDILVISPFVYEMLCILVVSLDDF